MTPQSWISRDVLRLASGACVAIAILGASQPVMGQGCVAVRGGGLNALVPHSPGEVTDIDLGPGDWLFAISYRWLHSDRHFVGDDEQEHRQEQNTEVINDSHFWDLTVQYGITHRLSAALTIPFVYSDRSSLYEHKGNNSGERYHTQAGGLADMRLTAYAWLWDPRTARLGNIQIGIGLKMPTGDDDATDIFMRQSGPTLDYVDQSIQPGDGGWGFTTELNAWLYLLPQTGAYLQGFYLFNPENINGTPTRIANLGSTNVFNYMSVADQYMARGGITFAIAPEVGLSMSLGARIDGVPSEDAIGDSEGFRRPGYSVTIEPGVTWMKDKWTASLTAPVAVYRNRVRSVRDKITGGHGDAAFADFFITLSVARRF